MKLKQFVYNIIPQKLRPYWEKIAESQIGSRLAHGAFWSIIGTIVAKLLSLISLVIVARILGKSGYGQLGVLQSTVTMFALFAGFGLGQTANKFVAELRDKDPVRTGRIISMGGLIALATGFFMAIVLYVFAPWLATNTLAAPQLTPLLRISSLILIFEAMNGAQLGALFGFEAFKITAIISVFIGLLSFPAMLAGAYFGGLTGCVWALTFFRACNWLFSHIAIRKEAARFNVPMSFELSQHEFSILLNYSLPSMLSGLLASPILWACNAMIVNQPKGYAQMGIFQAADSFRLIIITLATTLSSPLLSILSNSIGNQTLNERLSRINIISSWSIGVVAAIILVSIPECAMLIYGTDFSGPDFKKTFILLIFCASIVIYKQGLSRVLAANELMWWGMLSNFTWGVSMIVLTWLLLARGAFGFALAWTISYSLNTIIFIPLYTRKRLVPKGTILSLEAFYVWSILILCMTLSLLDVNILIRIILIPVFITGVCYFFCRLLKAGKYHEVCHE